MNFVQKYSSAKIIIIFEPPRKYTYTTQRGGNFFFCQLSEKNIQVDPYF